MRLLFASLWVLAATMPATAQPAEVQRAFEKGNRHYADGEYAAAIEQYDRVLESPWASGAFYYNVAGAHYRLGHTGQAIRYYEKARRLVPQNERLQHNLSVVRSQVEAPPPVPRSFRALAHERLTAFMSPLGYLGIGLVLYLLALGWWVRTRRRADERLRPAAGTAALMAAGLLVAGVGLALSASPDRGRAVALQGPLTIRSTPAPDADSTAALPEGTVLRLTGRRDGWAQVRTSRGETGWVQHEALGEI